jgi:phage gpG-like protein
MTSAVRTEIIGDKRLAATMRSAAIQIQDMESTNKGIGERVRARASSNAPKVTGRLAGSVRASASSREVVVASSLEYAGVIERGKPSVGTPAQPFMANAMRDTERQNVDDIERRVNLACAQIKGA